MMVEVEITSDHFVIGSMRHPRGTRMTFPLQVANQLQFEQKVRILDETEPTKEETYKRSDLNPEPAEPKAEDAPVRRKRTYRRRDLKAKGSDE